MPITPTTNAKAFVGIDEACAILGFNKDYLYRLTSQRQIPHYKPTGRKVYFKIDELNEWIQGGRVSTMQEIQSHAVTYCHITPMRRKGDVAV